MNKLIYLDNAATTKTAPEVVEAMLPYFTECYGNPSSIYSLGSTSKKAVIESRETIAAVLACKTNEIYFTAGGSEADNWAIKAAAEAYASKGKHIITSKIEHHAVLHTCEYLEKQGYEVTYLNVDENGVVVGNSKNCYGYFNEDGNGYWFNDFFEVTLLNDDNADGNPDLDLNADNGLYKATNTLSYTDFTAMIANTSPREDEAPVFEDFLKVYDAVIATAADQVTAKNKTIAELKDWVADWDGKEAELRAWVEAKNAEIAEVRAAYEEFTKAEDANEAAKKNVDALQAEYQALSTLLTSNGNDDLKNKIREIEGKITTAENAIKDAKLVLASLKTADTSWGYNYQTIAYKEKLVEQYKAEIAKYEEEIKFYTQMVANAKAALDAELSAQNAE